MKTLRKTAVIILLGLVLCFCSCDSGNLLEPFGGEDEQFNPANVNNLKEPDFITYTVTRRLYEALNENEKIAYRRIYNEIFSHPSKILIPLLTEEEIKNVFLSLKYDNPHLLCLKNTYTYYRTGTKCYIIPEYSYAEDECNGRMNRLVEAAKELCVKAPMTGDGFFTELYLHDALLTCTAYGEGDDTDNAYGALVNKKAACGGYTLACKLLFDMAGIVSAAISGKANDSEGNSVPHMWLCVNVNGEWYFTDPTWDDPVSASGNESLRHTYFNVSENELKLTHSAYVLPPGIECNSTDEDYYSRSGCYCTAKGWESTVQTAVIKTEEIPVHYEFRFENSECFEEAKRKLFTENGLSGAIDDSPGITAEECILLHSFDEDRLIIHIYINSETEA